MNGYLNNDKNYCNESLYTYLKNTKGLKPLSEEEEKDLFKRIKQGDNLAREKVIVHNLRFVVYIARKYAFLGNSILDIIEDGNEGLIKAVDAFNPDLGVRFIYFAEGYIRGYILMSLRRNSQIVRLPSSLYNNLIKYNQIPEREKYNLEDIAKILDISLYEAKMVVLYSKESVSIDYLKEYNFNEEIIIDKLFNIDKKIILDELKNNIEKLKQMANLTDKEYKVVELVTNNPGITFSQIGEILNFSHQNARCKYFNALYKLRMCENIYDFLDYSINPDKAKSNIEYCRRLYLEDSGNRIKSIL